LVIEPEETSSIQINILKPVRRCLGIGGSGP
jgi:hypothetical protein